MMIRMQLLR